MIVLAVVALTIAGKVVIRVAPEWLEPVNTFSVVVQPPGTRKSAVMKHLTAPVEGWEAKRHAEVAPRIAEFKARKDIAEKVLQNAMKEAANASPGLPPVPWTVDGFRDSVQDRLAPLVVDRARGSRGRSGGGAGCTSPR